MGSEQNIHPTIVRKKCRVTGEESDIDCCLLCEIGHMLPFISGLIQCTICQQLNRPTKPFSRILLFEVFFKQFGEVWFQLEGKSELE